MHELNLRVPDPNQSLTDRGALAVQKILAPVLLRRTKESTLDGKKIIELPPRNEEWESLEFTPEEKEMFVHLDFCILGV